MWRDRHAAIALEAALVMPVMIIILFGVVDSVRALVAWEDVTITAQEVAEIGTELASEASDGTYQLTVAQAVAATTAIYATVPGLTASVTPAFAVTLSAIAFTASPTGCTTACTYTANVAWSVVGSYDSNETAASLALLRRPCGTQAQTSSTAVPSLTSVPTAGLTGLTSLLVADVVYSWQPLFLKYFTGTISMRRAAWLPPRPGGAAAYIEYDVANYTTDSNVCTGYL